MLTYLVIVSIFWFKNLMRVVSIYDFSFSELERKIVKNRFFVNIPVFFAVFSQFFPRNFHRRKISKNGI